MDAVSRALIAAFASANANIVCWTVNENRICGAGLFC